MIVVIRGAPHLHRSMDCGRVSQKDKGEACTPNNHRLGRGFSVLAGSSGMEKLFLRPILDVGVEISHSVLGTWLER
jgi:hypothetical protein